MKKFCALLVSLVFVLSLVAVVSPVFAGGGKNQGDVGQGTVSRVILVMMMHLLVAMRWGIK